ncbi:BTB/POZ domain-containing protein [Acorus calamus]|uniref:BTB/POZ domain-containing protein n=1 Tax=Acorus calamus TaxID=4465 RepID=A0AAV9FRQ9_ACOCL|nr:BTB/POZ domain-containing protein [Acorus calamus]
MAEELHREHHPHVDVCTSIFNNPIFSDRVLKIQSKDGAKDMYMHVSSGLLASKSKFFFKLLSNGMKETNENQIILQINAKYERDVVVELLKFMHDNELSPETMASYSHLLSLLRFADMYEVTSCVNYCINTLLPRLPMSLESAAHILDLPRSLLTSYDHSIKAFVDEAKKVILNWYGDMNKLKEEVASLPLPVVELVLCWDGLLASEDEIYDTLLTWARANYLNIKRRRNFLKLNLNRFVRVGYMTYSKLKALCVCEDLHPEVAKDMVIDALLFKGENPSPMVRVEIDHGCYLVEVAEFRKSSQGFMVSLTLEEETIMKWTPNELKHTKTFVFGGDKYSAISEKAVEAKRCNILRCMGREMDSSWLTFDSEEVIFQVFKQALTGFQANKPSPVLHNVHQLIHKVTNIVQFLKRLWKPKVVRVLVPRMTLDDLFEQKGDVVKAVFEELEKVMGAYGYSIDTS